MTISLSDDAAEKPEGTMIRIVYRFAGKNGRRQTPLRPRSASRTRPALGALTHLRTLSDSWKPRVLGPRLRQSRRLILTILTGYRPKSREMAANTSSARLPRPWTSDGLSRYCPFAEFSRVAGVDAPAFVER